MERTTQGIKALMSLAVPEVGVVHDSSLMFDLPAIRKATSLHLGNSLALLGEAAKMIPEFDKLCPDMKVPEMNLAHLLGSNDIIKLLKIIVINEGKKTELVDLKKEIGAVKDRPFLNKLNVLINKGLIIWSSSAHDKVQLSGNGHVLFNKEDGLLRHLLKIDSKTN